MQQFDKKIFYNQHIDKIRTLVNLQTAPSIE